MYGYAAFPTHNTTATNNEFRDGLENEVMKNSYLSNKMSFWMKTLAAWVCLWEVYTLL